LGGEVLQLERGVGGDEGVDGMHAPRRRPELARRRIRALEPDLFACAEEKDDRMPQLCTIQRSQCKDERRAAHAVIERPAGRAGPGEPHVLFRHRNRLADLYAERLRARAA